MKCTQVTSMASLVLTYLVTSSDGGKKINTAFLVDGLFKNPFSASYFVSLEYKTKKYIH